MPMQHLVSLISPALSMTAVISTKTLIQSSIPLLYNPYHKWLAVQTLQEGLMKVLSGFQLLESFRWKLKLPTVLEKKESQVVYMWWLPIIHLKYLKYRKIIPLIPLILRLAASIRVMMWNNKNRFKMNKKKKRKLRKVLLHLRFLNPSQT